MFRGLCVLDKGNRLIKFHPDDVKCLNVNTLEWMDMTIEGSDEILKRSSGYSVYDGTNIYFGCGYKYEENIPVHVYPVDEVNFMTLNFMNGHVSLRTVKCTS